MSIKKEVLSDFLLVFRCSVYKMIQFEVSIFLKKGYLSSFQGGNWLEIPASHECHLHLSSAGCMNAK